LNKKAISNYENELFQSELEKFRPHQNRLLQANHKQSSLMKELTASFNSLLQDKRVRSEQSKYEAIQRQRSSVVNRYKRAYQEFLDLESGLQSAKNWYTEMKETVESLEKNVETFVNNRRAEGSQLLGQIDQENRVNKTSQAEMERERLRGLMERMSVDPNHSSPSPNPASSRPTPAPLTFNNTPRYPQANFVGQYQVPNSPPSNQANYPGFSSPPPNSTYAPAQQQSYTPNPQQSNQQYGQATYNPSNWGRNPGPVSPPPTQTSFGLGVSGRGPASPPPTQTSFAQNQYSTYGNPQAQQSQQFVPPGFVPPPPPPGPPPLGPQQTIHYNQHQQHQQHQQEYQYGGSQSTAPRSAQPHQQQQPQDPWAGLNAWK
jgi:hypothetical protein